MTTELLATSAVIGTSVLRLSIARGGGVLDDITSDVYVRGLLECDAELVQRACDALSREPREDYQQAMPPLPTILERVRAIHRADIEARARAKALPPAPNERTFACYKCEDDPAGWMVIMRCPDVDCGEPHYKQGERVEHTPHTFTVRCPCWLEKNREALLFAKQERLRENLPMSRDIHAMHAIDDGRYQWVKPESTWARRNGTG